MGAKKDANQQDKATKEEEKQQDNDFTGKNWSAQDVQSLTKAIVKFPAGTIDRWKVIA
jgi:hypothetical protein